MVLAANGLAHQTSSRAATLPPAMAGQRRVLNDPLTQTPTAILQQAVVRIVAAAGIPLDRRRVGRETVSGVMDNTYQVPRTLRPSVSCLASPVTPTKAILVSTSPTTTTFPWKHLATMFRNLSLLSITHLLTTICSATSSLLDTLSLRQCKSTPSPLSWLVAT